ncbi:hypothetical protein C8Q75DRAFT_729641 [Abortiporus biennis]|nr:hypothetical protein C8Q75DRAFT_729641 [Abortiporus biennis]
MPSITANSKVLLSLLCAFVSITWAIPAFESMTQWSSTTTLVPGLTTLEAIGPGIIDPQNYVPQYVSVLADRGSPGNATIRRDNAPPLFYVYQSQLYNYHNDSSILPVQLHNSTMSSKFPLQVVVGDTGKQAKKTLVKGGSWRWQGTILRYEHGPYSTPLFYSCLDVNGLMGLFVSTEPSPTPSGCTAFTIHSFNRQWIEKK